jgi:uncharacterized protein YeaO (DUF488 family)
MASCTCGLPGGWGLAWLTGLGPLDQTSGDGLYHLSTAGRVHRRISRHREPEGAGFSGPSQARDNAIAAKAAARTGDEEGQPVHSAIGILAALPRPARMRKASGAGATTRPAVPCLAGSTYDCRLSASRRKRHEPGVAGCGFASASRITPETPPRREELAGDQNQTALSLPTLPMELAFNHNPRKWAQLQLQYRRELDANRVVLEPILKAAQPGKVSLVYSARDAEHNHALVFQQYAEDKLAK